MASKRLGFRQVLAPAAALVLIAGGVMVRPDAQHTASPSLMERANGATAAIAGWLCPPEEDVVVKTQFAEPLVVTYGHEDLLPQKAGGTANLMMLTQAGDDGVYELTIKNGQMSAKVNGKTLDSKRIKKNGEQITLLDENGEEIATFTVGKKGDAFFGLVGEPRRLVLEERAANLPFGVPAQQSNQPKVMVGITMSDAPREVIQGIVIDRVIEGLPANKAGLKAGDIIIEVKGLENVQQDALRSVLRKADPGEELRVRVLRGGAVEDHVIKLEKYDGAKLGVPAATEMKFAPNTFTFDGDVQIALEEAMKHGHFVHDEAAQKALANALKHFESKEWAEQMGEVEWAEKLGDLTFDVQIDPELMEWKFFTDDEGRSFTMPKGLPDGAHAFRWETNDQAQELENRLQRLEEKLERLEKMLEKLTGEH